MCVCCIKFCHFCTSAFIILYSAPIQYHLATRPFISCHFARKLETDIRQYLHQYTVNRIEYIEKVGAKFLKALGVTADQYSNTLLSNDTPLDLLGVFIVACLYRIHVAVIMSGGVWSTSRTNNIRLAKFTLIYRNVTEFVETCYLDGAALYIDSLILNMQHGRMACHRDIAKLEGAETTADESVDLTVSDDTAKDQPVVPIDMKPVIKLERLDNKKALKFNVILQKPTNREKASAYAKALQILLKAKTELATKSEHKDITGKIKQHIQSGIIDPALVTKCARANRMISCNCEFCGELCRSRRVYV